MINSAYKKDEVVVKQRKRAFDAKRLRHLRETLTKFNQSEFAALVGLTQNQYTRYENGASEPSPHLIVELAKALNTSTDYLLGMIDDPFAHLREEDLTEVERRFLRALRRNDSEMEQEVGLDSEKPNGK